MVDHTLIFTFRAALDEIYNNRWVGSREEEDEDLRKTNRETLRANTPYRTVLIYRLLQFGSGLGGRTSRCAAAADDDDVARRAFMRRG